MVMAWESVVAFLGEIVPFVRCRCGPLFQELRRLGYVEGQNLMVDWYFGEGRVERYGELARDVARLKPDLVFALTTAIAQKLKQRRQQSPSSGS
jgi:ABC-type uncharacterized transport system substrate-binding protein